MVNVKNKRFRELNRRYKAVTGEILPMEMIPLSELYETLEQHVEACEKAGKDMLPGIYGWDLSGNTFY
ncbi:MAG: hypothetical protein ACOX3P_00800 [Saccharofermentanales bacterium]|nr:hypothetical protein [Bacillota bacterium]